MIPLQIFFDVYVRRLEERGTLQIVLNCASYGLHADERGKTKFWKPCSLHTLLKLKAKIKRSKVSISQDISSSRVLSSLIMTNF